MCKYWLVVENSLSDSGDWESSEILSNQEAAVAGVYLFIHPPAVMCSQCWASGRTEGDHLEEHS